MKERREAEGIEPNEPEVEEPPPRNVGLLRPINAHRIEEEKEVQERLQFNVDGSMREVGPKKKVENPYSSEVRGARLERRKVPTRRAFLDVEGNVEQMPIMDNDR